MTCEIVMCSEYHCHCTYSCMINSGYYVDAHGYYAHGYYAHLATIVRCIRRN